jgi:hypothetical protein
MRRRRNGARYEVGISADLYEPEGDEIDPWEIAESIDGMEDVWEAGWAPDGSGRLEIVGLVNSMQGDPHELMKEIRAAVREMTDARDVVVVVNYSD